MKVLVVGGAGYIGGGVTDILKERGISFTVYDNLLYEDLFLKPVDFIFGDVRDTEKLKKLLKEHTHVIWLAAIVGDAACQIKPDLTNAVNEDAVKWLADNFDGRIVFASTCSVYGQNDDELDEESSLNPLSLYAQTKMQAEDYLKDKNAMIFRLGTVYGMSDTYSRLRMDLVVNYMTARAHNFGKLSVFGGAQWRPLIHVMNVAEAIVNALDTEHTGIYNLSTSNYTMKELGQEIADLTGCDVEFVEQKVEDQRNYRVKNDKAKASGLLEFKPVLRVEDGVRQIYNAIKSGRVRYVDSDIYSNERHIANLEKNGQL
ncbi:MAG: NAD(P)-dependent oxidoreductase [Candidatus Colwellbacteria bacterium]